MINYFIGVGLGTSGIKEGVPISHIQGIAIDGQMGGVIGIDHHYDLDR